jgi:hypothetical protein
VVLLVTGDDYEFVPLCRHCGVRLVYGSHVAREWTHWNGPTFCQDSNGYTRSPVTRAKPTYFKPQPDDPRAWTV